MSESARIIMLPEVATLLRVHASTIYRLINSGQLPAFKVGGTWRFRADQIDRWRLEQERLAQRVLDRSRIYRA